MTENMVLVIIPILLIISWNAALLFGSLEAASTGLNDLDLRGAIFVGLLLNEKGDGHVVDDLADDPVHSLEGENWLSWVGLDLVLCFMSVACGVGTEQGVITMVQTPVRFLMFLSAGAAILSIDTNIEFLSVPEQIDKQVKKDCRFREDTKAVSCLLNKGGACKCHTCIVTLIATLPRLLMKPGSMYIDAIPSYRVNLSSCPIKSGTELVLFVVSGVGLCKSTPSS
jgi:hypothetical protein